MATESPLPARLHLYDAAAPGELDVPALADWLQEEVAGLRVDVRTDFVSHHLADDEAGEGLARELARAKVRHPDRRAGEARPLPGEVQFEERFLTAGGRKPAGLLYDGELLAAALAGLLPSGEADARHCHVALTNQLVGTWQAAEARYHARACVFGFPTLISTTGLVEAPARPRDYYVGRGLGFAPHQLQEGPAGRWLERGDPRLQEVVKGYMLQALFYHASGRPFCEDRDCRLYNAHWQEELIHAQTRPGAGLCDTHRRALEEWT